MKLSNRETATSSEEADVSSNGGRRGNPSPSLVSDQGSLSDPLRWRVLRDGALPGPVNMARDHALATELRPGTGVLRPLLNRMGLGSEIIAVLERDLCKT